MRFQTTLRYCSPLPILAALSICATAQLPAHSELFEFTAGGTHSGADLGASVAVFNNTAIVGAPGQNNRGRAYLLDLLTGQVERTFDHQQPELFDDFGTGVAVRGQFVVIGTPRDRINNHQPTLATGSATVFNRFDGSQLAFIWPNDAGNGDAFGSAIAISGGVVVVGAPKNDDDGSDSGCVYVFDILTGAQFAKITASDGRPGARFGSSLAASGSTLIVGAPYDDENGNSAGAAYLFDLVTFAELGKLLPSDGGPNSDFGASVAIDGDLALVGGPRAGVAGAGYLFRASTGEQLHQFTACDGGSGTTCGSSVALFGTTAVVGARWHTPTPGGANTGMVDFYDTTTGAQRFRLLASNGDHLDNFGAALGASAGRVVVGAYRTGPLGSESGAVYTFDAAQVDNTGSAYCFGDGNGTACPCGASGNSGEGCANSGGAGGATMTGEGDASMTTDTFRFAIQGVPGNKPGLILRGAQQSGAGAGLAVGDGLLCATGQSARSHVQLTSAGSTLFNDFNGNAFADSSVGICVPTNYQFWYRDAANTCSGSGFNFSNAWTVNWLP